MNREGSTESLHVPLCKPVHAHSTRWRNVHKSLSKEFYFFWHIPKKKSGKQVVIAIVEEHHHVVPHWVNRAWKQHPCTPWITQPVGWVCKRARTHVVHFRWP